jgi:hypothetical protein
MAKASTKRSARVPFRESAARVAPGTGRGAPPAALEVVGAASVPSPSCRAALHPQGDAPGLGVSRLNGTGRFSGYVMRGRWLSDDRYVDLRNAAWMLRNSRVGTVNNPAALRLVIHASETLLAAGDPLADILEAFAELLIHP